VKVLIVQAIVIRKEMFESYFPLRGDNVVALISLLLIISDTKLVTDGFIL
jgi:hypothetical protein